MVVRRKKKHRKYRGHRTYGYGSHKKHRGGGSRGGRGKAGLHKHKWSYTVKYEPEHFGKRGFKRPKEVVKKKRSINLDDLDKIIKELREKGKIKGKGLIEVNLKDFGYDKLLGRGKISEPIVVKAKSFSRIAMKKIEEVGGKAVVE
ncbi:MAG TPA: 50S ribosomal protein L15 [Candidatus Aenigmarchaeota archaeon]|nr:50S ribosomal protein L15 [Candidatus Aenigmarchaeota archaeon]